MKRLREQYPIFLSIGVLLLTLVSSFAGLGIVLLLEQLFPGLQSAGDFVLQLAVELVMLVCLVLFACLLGMGHIFREKGAGFFRSLIPAGVILGYYLYAALASAIMSMYDPLQPLPNIACFILCMAAIGITDELAFRGLIARMVFDKYGHTTAGVWLTVVVSGTLFGAMHLINAMGGAISLSGVLIQVLGAAALGMCLGAVYVRCKNLWAVAAIHAFMDFCALISSGIFASTTIVDTVSSYSPVMLISALIYTGIAAILLRPSKLAPITGAEKSDAGTKIKLLISVLLLLLMAAAVLVLTV